MLSPLETGTTRGRPRERGRSRETGPSRGYLAPAGGARRRRRPASRCGEAGQGSSISYMEGPCLILSGRNAITSTGAGTVRRRPPECATAMIRGHDRGRARSLSGCAATESRQGQRQQACKPAASATRLVQDQSGCLPQAVVPGQRGRRPVAGRDEGGPQAVSTCRRLSGKAAAAIGARLRARSHPRRILASGVPGVSRKPRRAGLLPARQQDCRPTLCAQACGSLV